MVYAHSREFLKRKIKKLRKQIIKLQQEKMKALNQYYKTFDKEDLDFINELKKGEEE